MNDSSPEGLIQYALYRVNASEAFERYNISEESRRRKLGQLDSASLAPLYRGFGTHYAFIWVYILLKFNNSYFQFHPLFIFTEFIIL